MNVMFTVEDNLYKFLSWYSQRNNFTILFSLILFVTFTELLKEILNKFMNVAR